MIGRLFIYECPRWGLRNTYRMVEIDNDYNVDVTSAQLVPLTTRKGIQATWRSLTPLSNTASIWNVGERVNAIRYHRLIYSGHKSKPMIFVKWVAQLVEQAAKTAVSWVRLPSCFVVRFYDTPIDL